MNLIEFIYESNRSCTTTELTGSFLKFLSAYGLDRFVMSEMSHDTTKHKEDNHGILVNYPEEWMGHYIAHNYIDHDPVYQTALIARKPFTWDEVKNNVDIPKKSKRIMEEARECKLYDGIGLSIHRPFGKIIGMGISGSEQGIEYHKDAISCLYAAANQFFTVYADLTEMERIKEPDISITPREKEVLLWLARGKTKVEISYILYVSESCVKRHCENIYKKLNASNIPMAVTRALRAGLIKPY